MALLLLFLLFFIYPCVRLMWAAFYTEQTGFSLQAFSKFFGKSYYYDTILNSFKVSGAVMLLSLLIGVPFSYFFTYYHLKGRKVLFVLALLCTLSAPFIGAYSWIMLLGRSGVITRLFAGIGIDLGSDLRIQRHPAGPVPEAVPAGDDLHERRVPGHRQQPAGSLREPGLHRDQALLQGGDGPDDADHPGRGADRVHARLRRLRNARDHRRRVQDLPRADLRLLPERSGGRLQLRLGGERAGHRAHRPGVPAAEVCDQPLQVHHQLAEPHPEEEAEGPVRPADARLLLHPARRGHAAPGLHRPRFVPRLQGTGVPEHLLAVQLRQRGAEAAGALDDQHDGHLAAGAGGHHRRRGADRLPRGAPEQAAEQHGRHHLHAALHHARGGHRHLADHRLQRPALLPGRDAGHHGRRAGDPEDALYRAGRPRPS